jgi:radical SAM superfamily enzyme YgiQ (UPF0313 family)
VIFEGAKARPMITPPLGLMLPAAHARQSGWKGSIEIYDARLSGRIRRTADGTFFGDSESEIADRIRRSRPDVVGISSMFSPQATTALRVAEIAREVAPGVKVVIGGAHPTAEPLLTQEHPAIDYVVMGEGEGRFTQLLFALQRGETPRIEGVIGSAEDQGMLRRNPRAPITFIEPLDSLPFPAYDQVDLDAYFRLYRRGYSARYREWGRRPMTMLTSRGCPHTCTFCSIHLAMGYKFRFHSPEYVQRHIEHLVNRYGIDFIHFEDDNLTHAPERYDRIVDFLTRQNLKWDTPNGIRGDTWTRERVRQAKASGCQFLTVAIESPVDRVRNDLVRKRLSMDRVLEMIRLCHEERLRLHAFYIIGFPGETMAQMRQTVEFALFRYRAHGVVPFLQPVIPIVGTDLRKQVEDERLHQGALEVQYNQITTSDFGPDQVQALYKRYLRQRLMIFVWRALTSPRELLHSLRLVSRYPQAVVHALRNASRGAG